MLFGFERKAAKKEGEYFIQSSNSGLKGLLGSRFDEMMNDIRQNNNSISLSQLMHNYLRGFNIVVVSCKENDGVYNKMKKIMKDINKGRQQRVRALSYEEEELEIFNLDPKPYRETSEWLRNDDNQFEAFNGYNYISFDTIIDVFKQKIT